MAGSVRQALPTTSRTLGDVRFGVIPNIALGLLCTTWILAGLIGHEPWKPDEAYSFGIVLDFLRDGDWVVPTLAGEPFLEKPPLMFVTAAAFASMLRGALPVHDAARLASGFFMAWALVFLALTGRELHGRGRGWPAVVLMLGCLGLVVRAHQLIVDVALLAGVSTAIYGLASARRNSIAGGLALGTGVSVAFLAKGLLGPGFIGLGALSLWTLPSWRTTTFARAIRIAIFVALPVVAVWPLALYVRSPEYFSHWFVVNNLQRFLGVVHIGPSSPSPFYVPTLLWYAFPALPLAAWTWWIVRKDRCATNLELPTVMGLVILVVLMVAHDCRELYAMPLLLPLALLASARVDRLPLRTLDLAARVSTAVWGCIAASLWFGWIVLVSGEPTFLYAALARYRPGWRGEFGWLAFGAAAAATIAWLVLVLKNSSNAESRLVHWTAGLTLCWTLAMTLWLPYLDMGKSYRAMIASLAEQLPPGGCLASRSLGEPQRAMLDYYLGIRTIRQEIQPVVTCDALLAQGWRKDSPLVHENSWTLVWEGSRPGDKKELYQLFLRGTPQLADSTVHRFPEEEFERQNAATVLRQSRADEKKSSDDMAEVEQR